MSGNFRARRPASPPPGASHPAPTSQRFPHPRDEHLDADERRAAASKGFAPGRTKYYPPGGLDMTSGEWKLLFVVVLVACAVRLFRLSKPNSVVFDEVHFGKFASRYIKTRYFVDVHPPLAKLLITLAGFLFGYNGDFDFKDIGKVYEHVPYVAMRMLPATLGVATVPLAYLTLRALDCRATTALLASLFITFENGMVTQSRHILLDSPLIFFTALTTFFWCGFCNEDKHKPFTSSWWTWLTLTGLSLGAVVSCKWVGLFTIATIGVSTVFQLWNLLGDLRVTPRLFIRHFIARSICLILLPIVFYMAMFQIHFLILENSGEGDGFMSSEFQHTLGGRGMADTFADVAVGSQVTIRHVNTQGGYLHSHAHNYPTGSKQQQVTLYPHRDSNNDWRIFNATVDGDTHFDWANADLAYITPGMRIKLRHIITEKHLHSHDHRPPVSDVDFQNEVSAYGQPGFVGDANDDWFLEIEHGDKRDKESTKRLRTLRTTFRLRHALTGCYLFSHKVKLPAWGFEQQEVTCNKNAIRANSLWFVETATHPKLPPDAPKANYQLPGFFSKFWELQQVMWTTNAGLTDRHTYDSRPESWPLLRRGINFWVKDHRQIYLIGNPMVWYLSTLAVIIYVATRGLLILRAKRGYRDFDSTKVVKYDALCGFLFGGWLLHYFPFFLMGRQLFLHHYFPALYFAILLSCAIFDLITSTLRPRVRLQIAAVLIVLAIWNFQHLNSLAYGNPWTREKCEKAKWLKTWDFNCNEFYENYSQYNTPAGVTPAQNAIPVSTVGGEGRAPIVVQDKNAAALAAAPPPDAETSPVLGMPEPGRDIFADQPVKDIKSDGLVFDKKAAAAPAVGAGAGGGSAGSAGVGGGGGDGDGASMEEKEPKQISSVDMNVVHGITTDAPVSGAKKDATAEEAVKGDKEVPVADAKASTAEAAATAAAAVEKPAEAVVADAAQASPAAPTPATDAAAVPVIPAPLKEEEMEAVKAGEALFPDAV